MAPHTDTRMSKHKPQPDTLSAMPQTPHSALLLPAPPAATRGHKAGRYTQCTCFTGTKVPVYLLYLRAPPARAACCHKGPQGRQVYSVYLLYWYKSTSLLALPPRSSCPRRLLLPGATRQAGILFRLLALLVQKYPFICFTGTKVQTLALLAWLAGACPAVD